MGAYFWLMVMFSGECEHMGFDVLGGSWMVYVLLDLLLSRVAWSFYEHLVAHTSAKADKKLIEMLQMGTNQNAGNSTNQKACSRRY